MPPRVNRSEPSLLALGIALAFAPVRQAPAQEASPLDPVVVTATRADPVIRLTQVELPTGCRLLQLT